MKGPFQHILVAYDGSTEARLALDRAIDMALSWAARLSIVTVYQAPIMWSTGMMVPTEPPGEGEKRALNDLLREAVQLAKDRGVSQVRGELLQDHAAEAIVTFASSEHADLLVMGSRGRSTAPRLLLGSVSDAVIHHSRTAVLVVRAPARPSQPS
jgi:nucleotide-binding universal stress UspA family protein